MRSIRDRDWQELIYERSAVAIAGSQWIFSGEGTTEEIDNFTRIIDFTAVYRDTQGSQVSDSHPDATLDPDSKLVAVTISWAIRPGTDKALVYTTEVINLH